MHSHIKEVLEDFGPVYNFWLFAFKQYSGILRNQPNNRSIEPQLMNRFLRDNFAYLLDSPSELLRILFQCVVVMN